MRKPSARTLRRIDQSLVDAKKCGRPTRGAEAKGPYCTRPAGWGTDHVGSGACKLHGGCNPIKHGYDSEVIREKLGDSFQRFKEDPKIGEVDNEVALLRGIVEKAIRDGKESEDVAGLAERVVRAVDTMNKIKQKFGLTMETFNRVTGQMGVVVAKHVTSPEILAAIQREWDEIRVSAPSSGD